MSIREGMEIKKLQKRMDEQEQALLLVVEAVKEIKEKLSRRGRPPKSDYDPPAAQE